MKYKIEESKEKDFVPYEIIITVENKEEERELWHRLNIGPINASANYNPNSMFGKFPCCDIFNGLWKRIDNKIRRRNEKMKTVTIGNLEWQYEDDGVKRTWDDAIEYAKSLGGGWRVPTIHELFSIADTNRHDPASSTLLQCKSHYYWASSPNINNKGYFWYIDFCNGYVHWAYNNNNLNVRCVRNI